MPYTPAQHTANRFEKSDRTRAYDAALDYWNDTPASKRRKPPADTLEAATRSAAHRGTGLGLHELRDSERDDLDRLVDAARCADILFEPDYCHDCGNEITEPNRLEPDLCRPCENKPNFDRARGERFPY